MKEGERPQFSLVRGLIRKQRAPGGGFIPNGEAAADGFSWGEGWGATEQREELKCSSAQHRAGGPSWPPANAAPLEKERLSCSSYEQEENRAFGFLTRLTFHPVCVR